MVKEVTIYTDGACSGNPGPGGWGAVLIYKEVEKEISGYEDNTTNNRMEMTAVIEALGLLKESCNVTLYSDSAYIVNAINNHWVTNWVRNNWIKSDKKPVENTDLWKRIIELNSKHNVKYVKVKGHADNKYNNICDKLATDEIKKNRI